MSRAEKVPADQAARDRVSRTLDTSFLVEAGAGTGKTSVLLERVLGILKTDLPLDKIAVITFTEKGAGELKARLRKGIERMISEAGPAIPWRAHLERSLESLDRATVSTIHSFAASLLRERPVEAEVDPRFTVADGLATTMLMEEIWERWIEQEMASRSEPLARALRLGVTLKQIRQLAFRFVEQRDVEPELYPADEPRLEDARERIVSGVRELSSLSASCTDQGDRAARQIRELEARLPVLAGATGDHLLQMLHELPLRPDVGAQRNWSPPSILARAKGIVADLEARRKEATARARTCFARELAAWLRSGYLSAYRDAKDSRRVLDFADLLIICRETLLRSKAARVAFQERYTCILVDEFQDTDPVQSEILFLLAADDPDQTDWRQARPRPGKLFLVGDPKQSIYRFRRADIELYEDLKRRLPSHAKLTQNFRTVPSIVDWVNALFQVLIQPSDPGGCQPRYEPIEAFREEPRPGRSTEGGHAAGVILISPRDPEDLAGASVEKVRLQEARHVVALMNKAVQEGWTVVPEEGGDLRGIRHGDIALLFRTSTAFEIYEEVLREAGIPYRLSGGKRYYLRAEIQALQAVLAAIDRPHDPLSVASALRCPFFGHSDEDLLTHASGTGDWDYTGAGERGSPLDRSFALLARLHEKRNKRPVAATLEDLFEETGALALFYLKPDGGQRAANLLKSLDLARAHEELGGATFGAFVRWLGSMAIEEREEAEAPLTEDAEIRTEDTDADSVRIMTVHRAKGLEFPMVIHCDISGAPRQDRPTCIVERAAEATLLEFTFGSGKHRFESAGYEEALEREKRRLLAESRRLFYVAATRARDYLVIPVFGGKRPAGVHDMLSESGFLPGGGPVREIPGARVLEGASLEISRRTVKPLRILAEESVPADPALTIEKEGWRQALRVALDAPTMGRAFRSASGMERAPSAGHRPPAHDPEGRAARAAGTAVHGVLERIDLSTGRDIGLLSEEEAAACGYPGLAAEVRALAEKALRSKIVREALAAPRYFREMPFVAAGDVFFSEGRIDLLFEAGGGLTVVDFKTDKVESESEIDARVEVYRPQASIYACSLSRIAGLPVTRVVLYFIRPDVERSLKVDESFLEQGRRLLETGSLHISP